jgi:hypothetical protein
MPPRGEIIPAHRNPTTKGIILQKSVGNSLAIQELVEINYSGEFATLPSAEPAL